MVCPFLGLPFSSVGYSIQESSQVEDSRPATSLPPTKVPEDCIGVPDQCLQTDPQPLFGCGVLVIFTAPSISRNRRESASVNRESMKSSLYAEGGLQLHSSLRKAQLHIRSYLYAPSSAQSGQHAHLFQYFGSG